MTNQENIRRLAEFIVPAVFKAEQELLENHPEWRDRLRALTDPTLKATANEYCNAIAYGYCTAIATLIVKNADDYVPDEMDKKGNIKPRIKH